MSKSLIWLEIDVSFRFACPEPFILFVRLMIRQALIAGLREDQIGCPNTLIIVALALFLIGAVTVAIASAI